MYKCSKFEDLLINHCAPTLAGMKSGSMFSYEYGDLGNLKMLLDIWQPRFSDKGMKMEVLRKSDKKALIYIYRRQELEQTLRDRQIQDILTVCGYQDHTVDGAMNYLKSKMQESGCFPHEIGIFLGYPLHDVIGFIRNKGKNCCLCGYWKVYCDEYQAQQTFARYTTCRVKYRQLFEQGAAVTQLIVPA